MENEKTKENQTQETKDNAFAGLSIVDEAKKVRDEIRAENDRREKILQEEQRLRAEQMLGGTTGKHIEPVVKEETAKEYAERVMKNKVK